MTLCCNNNRRICFKCHSNYIVVEIYFRWLSSYITWRFVMLYNTILLVAPPNCFQFVSICSHSRRKYFHSEVVANGMFFFWSSLWWKICFYCSLLISSWRFCVVVISSHYYDYQPFLPHFSTTFHLYSNVWDDSFGFPIPLTSDEFSIRPFPSKSRGEFSLFVRAARLWRPFLADSSTALSL